MHLQPLEDQCPYAKYPLPRCATPEAEAECRAHLKKIFGIVDRQSRAPHDGIKLRGEIPHRLKIFQSFPVQLSHIERRTALPKTHEIQILAMATNLPIAKIRVQAVGIEQGSGAVDAVSSYTVGRRCCLGKRHVV